MCAVSLSIALLQIQVIVIFLCLLHLLPGFYFCDESERFILPLPYCFAVFRSVVNCDHSLAEVSLRCLQ